MSLLYAAKHVARSWHLFIALLLGIMLASAFFAGLNIKVNLTTQQALDQNLSMVYTDFEIMSYSPQFNLSHLDTVKQQLSNNGDVKGFEVMSRASSEATVYDGTNQSTTTYASLIGISDNSKVYDGWLNKPPEGLGENETYITENENVQFGTTQLKVGDIVSINFTIFNPETHAVTLLPLNLTVKGFAQLDDEAYSIATGYGPQRGPIGIIDQGKMYPVFPDSMLVNWEKTVEPFIEASSSSDSMPFQQSVVVYVNRESLISPWDIQGSVNNLQVLENSIVNKINSALGFQVTVQDNLLSSVQSLQLTSSLMIFGFIIISLPVFFMAWYTGTTVSDVSFSSRRREIGLLATKGFSTGQISRIFLFETILIGVVGSLLGVLLGFFLTPLFAPASNGIQFDLRTISPSTIAFTVIFGLIMAFLSTYASSRKATKIPTVGALREYMPNEPGSTYHKRLAWLALILGTYKIVVFITGVNVAVLLNRVVFSGGNIVIFLIGQIWIFIDSVLTLIGPLLFFWGFAKIFVQHSPKFQELTVRASKFLGDIGTLATKNVRRKPARAATIAFLIALIIWYGVLVTGQLASEKDYTTRQTYANVGADVTAEIINVANTSQAQAVLDNILANVSGIEDATVEYSISAQQSMLTLKAVDPKGWLKAAYYEAEWFSGASVQDAFAALAADDNTIILDRTIAKSYNLTVGDDISVEFENGTKALRVVAFFGPEPQDQTSTGIGFMPRIGSAYWSFVPTNLYAYPGNLTSAAAKILMKIDAGANGTAVAKNVLNVDDSIFYVDSVANELEKSQTDAVATGALDIMQLGTVFAVLAASVGTALISSVSMMERSREATIMSVKGLSYKQLVIMFLTESFALVTFAIVLGVSIGLISVYGTIASSNAQASGLVVMHLVFPLGSTLLVAGCIATIFAATILPIVIMSRKYVTKLERMIRLR